MKEVLLIVDKEYIREAQLYASLTVNSAERTPLSPSAPEEHFPYSNLSRAQAEWYFYWRAQVRKGNYLPTDPQYIFIHATELVHVVGANSPADAYQQLRSLWLSYREEDPQIDEYLLGWMLSFVTAHGRELLARDILLQSQAYKFTLGAAPDILLSRYLHGHLRELPLDLLAQFIDYDIRQSPFWSAGYRQFLQHAIAAALAMVNRWLIENRKRGLFTHLSVQDAVLEVKPCPQAVRTYSKWPTKITLTGVSAYSRHKGLRRLLTGLVKHTEAQLLRSFWHTIQYADGQWVEREVRPQEQRTSVSTRSDGASSKGAFIAQARRWASREAAYSKHIRFRQPRPTYSKMTRLQQDWYCYWRGQVRSGKYPETSISYIFVHAYELINKIGIDDVEDGYQQLRRLWLNYRDRHPELDYYLAIWTANYLTAHSSRDPLSMFSDKELQSALATEFPDIVLHVLLETSSGRADIPFFLLVKLINYRIEQSKFYRGAYKDRVEEEIHQAILAVDEQMRLQTGSRIFSKYRPASRTSLVYGSFDSAIFESDEEIVTKINVYAYSRHNALREFLTALVQHTENVLREKYGFSPKLEVPPLSEEIERTIRATVMEGATEERRSEGRLTSPSSPPPTERLETNRNEPLVEMPAKREKSVGEGEIESTSVPLVKIDLARVQALREESEDVLTLMQALREDTDGLSSDHILIETGREDRKWQRVEPVDGEAPNPKLTSTLTTDFNTEEAAWAEMAARLKDHQVEVLAAILNAENATETIHRIATEQFLMPAMLVDSINELAQDVIGDILIAVEPEPHLIDDYYLPVIGNIIEEKRSY